MVESTGEVIPHNEVVDVDMQHSLLADISTHLRYLSNGQRARVPQFPSYKQLENDPFSLIDSYFTQPNDDGIYPSWTGFHLGSKAGGVGSRGIVQAVPSVGVNVFETMPKRRDRDAPYEQYNGVCVAALTSGTELDLERLIKAGVIAARQYFPEQKVYNLEPISRPTETVDQRLQRVRKLVGSRTIGEEIDPESVESMMSRVGVPFPAWEGFAQRTDAQTRKPFYAIVFSNSTK